MPYIGYPLDTNPANIVQRIYSFLQTQMPGWLPAEGNLDVWLSEAYATEAAELMGVSTRVPDSIFRYLGASLFGVVPIEPTSAVGTTTWTMIDSLGHTIPAGTQVAIRDIQGTMVPFNTVNTVTVPPGSTSTADGEITILAVNPGSSGTSLGTVGGPVVLLDVLDFVDTVIISTTTYGGQDGETEGEYLNRLVNEFQLFTRTPILPDDFSQIARDIPSVWRATTLDLYDPATDTFNNPRMVTVVGIDENGEAVSGPVKTEMDNLLQALREVNFIVNIMDPTYTTIDVTVNVKLLPTFDSATVLAGVDQAIRNFLDPRRWGIPAGTAGSTDTREWVNETVVRRYDLAQVILAVNGVDYIVGNLLLRKSGGTLAEADVTMDGRVALPRAGAINVAVTP